jgi:hypothetical protein
MREGVSEGVLLGSFLYRLLNDLLNCSLNRNYNFSQGIRKMSFLSNSTKSRLLSGGKREKKGKDQRE